MVGDSRNQYDGGGRPRGGPVFEQPAPIQARPIPVDYVDEAERVMQRLLEDRGIGITTSKLRGFLSLVTEIYNVENLRTEPNLLPESQVKLMRVRVRVVYDAGRENAVMRFVKEARLLEYLKGIGGSRDSMIRFAHYMEALVAYHRYLGGKEN